MALRLKLCIMSKTKSNNSNKYFKLVYFTAIFFTGLIEVLIPRSNTTSVLGSVGVDVFSFTIKILVNFKDVSPDLKSQSYDRAKLSSLVAITAFSLFLSCMYTKKMQP